MAHRSLVREIAQQSGLSEATVDRVLNERPGVWRTPARRSCRPSPTSTAAARPAAVERQALPHRRGHADAAAVLR